MGYLTKAWQHRLYSFKWPLQICWQALKPSLKANLTWLNDDYFTSIYLSLISYFDTVFVQDRFVYIKYSGKVHASTRILAHAHTHTCKETSVLLLAYLQDHLWTHSNTLISIMHMYPFTLQQRLSSHHFLYFPFFLIVYNVISSNQCSFSVFPVYNHYQQFFRGTAMYSLKSTLPEQFIYLLFVYA